MANFVGAITEFNPYIQQIPTEAYTKVGMFKEQMYEAGVQKVQDNIDKIAGLDIANQGGREYLRARVDELTSTLNKYSQVDFSNPNNVAQLVSLSKPLYQDENIVNDVINTGLYRKWAKESSDAYKSGKMELGQYMRETTDASSWLNSKVAGAQYTGRNTPNTATKKELVDRIIKAKKDGMEKNEFVYDINYSKDTPYYIKSTNKYYSEAEFHNFVSEAIMTDKDREMLMNENWYENQGKPTQVLQQEDIAMYQSKINANNKRIEQLKNDPLLYAGDKKAETQQLIDDLKNYNTMLQKGKIKFLQDLNLADPQSRDVFHRDLAESRFISSLGVLTDEVRKEEFQKNEQWFKDKELEIELTKEALKATGTKDATGKKKTPTEQIDEVSVFTPVDPSAPRTELSLNTIQRGYQIKNEEINQAMNSLIGKLQENGVNLGDYIAGWDQVQVGTKGGAAMNIPRFKDAAAKERFYNMIAGLNYAYTKEAEDGKLDNQSFTKYVKDNFTNYKDEDPNSKFTHADKMVSDALNSLKGTSALLPRLEKLFADKGVVRTLAQVDEALKSKKDMANAYREALYKSNALTTDEMKSLKSLNDDQILGQGYFFDKQQETQRLAQRGYKASYTYKKEPDGTFAIYQNVIEDPNNDFVVGSHDYALLPDNMALLGDDKLIEKNKLVGGFKNESAARTAFKNEGQLGLQIGISKGSMKKAEEFVKKTYSYVQENLNTTVQNLKEDKPAYSAVQDGLTLFMNRAKLQAGTQDIQIDGVADLRTVSAISNIEVLGASVSNTEDIFNPNPMYEVQGKLTDAEGKERNFNGRVSLRSFLATNPNYKTSEYAKYFAPALYSEKDAYARIKATVNPLEGSEASYQPRADIEPVFQRVSKAGTPEYAGDADSQIQWETLPIEKDGKQTIISYQVVSLGQNTVLGNAKNKDGQQYQAGAFYVKLKIPTSTGQPKTLFLKKPSGDSYVFNSASYAHYTIRDLIFNNSELKFDEIDPKTGEPNYFTTDPTTIRGILNSQLSYNGFSKLDTIKIKDALGREITKEQAKELQFGTR